MIPEMKSGVPFWAILGNRKMNFEYGHFYIWSTVDFRESWSDIQSLFASNILNWNLHSLSIYTQFEINTLIEIYVRGFPLMSWRAQKDDVWFSFAQEKGVARNVVLCCDVLEVNHNCRISVTQK